MAETPEARSTVLSIRVSDEERLILEAASMRARTSVSEFVRRSAVQAAECQVLQQRSATIPAAKGDAFENWAKRPAEEIPALRELACSEPTWRR